MAAAVALLPTNPEVFGVLLYSAWWVSLWALYLPGLRAGACGSFSRHSLPSRRSAHPAGGALSVVFGIAYFRHRRVQDGVSAIILLTGLTVQAVLTLTSSRATTGEL